MSGSPRACAFVCGSAAKMSAEHFWGDWISRLFYPKPRRRQLIIRQVLGKTTPRIWNSAKIDLTAKVVCEPCNNEWMNDLENYVRPFLSPVILHGTEMTLSRDQEAGLIAWITKTAIVLDHAHPTPK